MNSAEFSFFGGISTLCCIVVSNLQPPCFGGEKGEGNKDTMKKFIFVFLFTCTGAESAQLVGSEITLCTNGFSPDGSTCTTYGTSNCPTDYYNVNVGATSFAQNTGSCASGYKQYEAEDSCGFEPEGKTCVNFCENGDMTTGTGGCSALCGEGATTFRTSTGLKYPLWATKQTTPSLNVGFASGNRCYMSLTSEPTNTQSIWFQWENNKMHATK